MTTPITWRNVDAPDLTPAARLMAAAQQSFLGAVSPLEQVLRRTEAVDEANWQQGKTNNTNAFLDKLYGFKSAEDLAAAQQSGELDQLRQSFGAQVDSNMVRSAQDNRLNTLYEQFRGSEAYKDAKMRPVYEQLMGLAAKGDNMGLDLLASQNPEAYKRFQGQILKAELEGSRAAEQQLWQRQRAAREEAEAPVRLDQMRASAYASRKQAEAAGASTQLAQVRLAMEQEDRLMKRLTDLRTQALSTSSTISSEDGSKFVIDEIKKVVADPKAQKELLEAFGKIAQDPTARNATPALVLQSLLGDMDRNWLWKDSGDKALGNIKQIMSSPEYIEQQGQRNTLKDVHRIQARELEAQLEALRASFRGKGGKQADAPSPTPSPAPVPNPQPSSGTQQPTTGAQAPEAPAVGEQGNPTSWDGIVARFSARNQAWRDKVSSVSLPTMPRTQLPETATPLERLAARNADWRRFIGLEKDPAEKKSPK